MGTNSTGDTFKSDSVRSASPLDHKGGEDHTVHAAVGHIELPHVAVDTCTDNVH